MSFLVILCSVGIVHVISEQTKNNYAIAQYLY